MFKKLFAMAIALIVLTITMLAMPPKQNGIISHEPKIDYRIGAVRDEGKKDIINNPFSGKVIPLISGTKYFPAVLMKFPDLNGQYTAADFDWLCFDFSNPNLNSLNTYYWYNSGYTLNVTGQTYGWFTTIHNRSYYSDAGNNSIQCAVEAAQNAITLGINWAQFDNDSNGLVDAFIVFHAGFGAEETHDTLNEIWSHNSRIIPPIQTSTPWPNHPGEYIKISNYTIQPEKQTVQGTPGLVKVGVIAHEMGHAFGLPDFYDVGGTGSGLGNFCSMAGGSWGGQGNNLALPTYMSAFPRILLGWINPVEITTNAYYLIPRNESNSMAFVVPAESPYNEGFIIENRRPYSYDAELYNHGLYIYHIDATIITAFLPTNTINQNTHAYGVALEEADADFPDTFSNTHLFTGTNRGSPDDIWPLGAFNHFDSLVVNWPPTSKSNWGLGNTGVSITNISNTADTMIAQICVRPGTGVDGKPATPINYSSYIVLNPYPNPTKGLTNLKYQLPKASTVTIKLYNINGQVVESRDMPKQEAGWHQYQCNNKHLSKGVYFYRLTAGVYQATRKLVIIK